MKGNIRTADFLVLFLFPNRALNSATDGVARYISSTIDFNSYAATGTRTHGRVAPDWDLPDALLTELHGRGDLHVLTV